MLWAIAAFFLAMGVAAHALDELHGRPLRTRDPGGGARRDRGREPRAARSRSGSGPPPPGATGCSSSSAIGAVLVPAYNLELALHTDWGFALCWGVFPALTGYFVEAQTLRLEAVAAAGYAFALSLAQRALSTPVREARREPLDDGGHRAARARAAACSSGLRC